MQVSKIYDFVKTNEDYFHLFLRFYVCEPRDGSEHEFYDDAAPAEVPMGTYDEATPADPMDIDPSGTDFGKENLPPRLDSKLAVACLPESSGARISPSH